MICSDGLWSLIPPDDILKLTRRNPSKMAAKKLIQLALKRGAPDNVTVVVVRLGKAPRQFGIF
jgi:serine/threonine protein phosphatase PrpC